MGERIVTIHELLSDAFEKRKREWIELIVNKQKGLKMHSARDEKMASIKGQTRERMVCKKGLFRNIFYSIF